MSKIKIVDSDHTQIELDISEEHNLRDLLYNLLKQEPRVVIIEISNIGIFTLGVGLPYGCVQYSKDWEPPYLMALNSATSLETSSDDELEFDSGGTPTPIPLRQCLPFDQVVGIVIYCFKNKELPQYIKWEEI